MRVLITGGAGFVGSHLVNHFLVNTDWEIIILDRLSYASNGFDRIRDINAFDDKRILILTADLVNPIREGLAKEIGEVTYIFHLAANSHVDNSIKNPVPFVYDNVVGTVNLLEFAKTLKNLERFVYLGTDEVYGSAPEGVNHSEGSPHLPGNPYCLLPDTQVITKRGYMPIQDVEVGNGKVLSKYPLNWHFGDGIPSKKWEFDYDGNVRKIETDCSIIVVTLAHKFFRKEHIIVKSNKPHLFDSNGRLVEHYAYTKMCEVPASNLRRGDYILVLRTVPFKHNSIDTTDKRFARFLGYFLGDGSYSSKSRYVRLADQKLHFLTYYKSILEDYLGKSKHSTTGQFGNLYKHSTKDCYYLQFMSEKLRNQINLVNKHNILQYALNLNENGLKEFLAGFFDAEAYLQYEDNLLTSIHIYQSKHNILEVLQFLLRRIGIISKLVEQTLKGNNKRIRKGWKLIITENVSLRKVVQNIPTLKIKGNTVFRKGQHHNRISKRFYWSQIHRITDMPYSGKVYDLEISNWHNYIANYFVVHNSASKAASEDFCHAYANTYKLPIIISSSMNIIGERQHSEKFVPLVIRSVLQGETVLIHADPTRTKPGSRFYIHARNVADALLFILWNTTENLKSGDRSSGRFNIVGEKEVNNLEMAQFIADVIGKPLKYELVSWHQSRPGHDLRYSLSGEKLERLGWKLPKTFEESLTKTIRWYLDPKNIRWLNT